MNIGSLDREVTLLAPVAVPQDAYGAPAPVQYEERATVWASLKFGAGTEATDAQQLTAQQVVTWTLRYRADVLPTWRLRYNETTYQLTAVAEIGRRVGLTLTTYARG